MKPLTFVFAFVVVSGAAASTPLAAQNGVPPERPHVPQTAMSAAQAASPKPSEQPAAPMIVAAPARPVAPVGFGRNVQVDVTVSLEGGSTPITKRMTLVAAEDTDARGRSGIEVPVATGSLGPGGDSPAPMRSYSYRSVGLNVDARPRVTDIGRIALMLKLEFSAVLKAAENSGPGLPAFGKSNTDLNLVLESGKPITITQSSDAEIGRGYTVEVKATLLR